jgi:hypothetical protein
VKEIFPSLLKQRKWYKYKRDAKVGDVVLRKDETAAGQTYKYVRIVGVNLGSDGKVRSGDVEYKIPGESKFRVTTRPIHKLILVVPVEEQMIEEPGEEKIKKKAIHRAQVVAAWRKTWMRGGWQRRAHRQQIQKNQGPKQEKGKWKTTCGAQVVVT